MSYLIITIAIIIAIFLFSIIIISVLSINILKSIKSSIDTYILNINNKFDLFIKSVKNFILICKPHIKYEDNLFIELETQIDLLNKAKSICKKANAKQIIDNNINSILELSEAYTSLSNSEDFINSKNNIIKINEEFNKDITIYNEYVTKYNIRLEKFPYKIFKNILNYKQLELFIPKKQKEKSIEIDM